MAATVLTPTNVPREAWLRVRAAGSDCIEPAPVPQLLAFPDFERLPEQTGERRWTMVGYDIGAGGKPVHIRTVGGTAGPALAAAGVSAIGRSRYERKARTGCLYPYWQRSRPIAAPEPPSQESLRPAGATCPDPLPYDKQPTLTFPQNYQRRNIEGWATVAFDVAPWGATGNWRVLAAEPAAEFGDWALTVVRGATKRPSITGYVGCVDRVRFRIADKVALIVADAALPPPD
jgi:TonB family protein